MEFMKKLGIVMGIAVFAMGSIHAATSSVAIFNHSTGARQLGMADVAVGMADDANLLFYNPGGIASVRKRELNAMYFDNILDTKDESISFLYPLKKGLLGQKAGWGFGIKAYQGGDLEYIGYDEATETITERKNLTAESDYMAGIGYGEQIFDKRGSLYGGVYIKGIHSTLVEDYTASAMAVDLGLLYKTPLEGLAVGISSLNNGTEMKFISEGDALPARTVMGASYGFKPAAIADLTIGMDHIIERDAESMTNIGLELTLLKMVMVRSGYYADADLASVTAGIGVRYRMFQIDYGYGMMDELNHLHKISLTVRWDAPEEETMVKTPAQKALKRKSSVKKRSSTKRSSRELIKSRKKYSLKK